MGGVHVEQANRSPASWGQPHNLAALKIKVISPGILARIEEQHNLLRIGIDTAQIWSLVRVAPITGQSKLREIGFRVQVLFCDDMLNVKSEIGRRNLGNQAVLAP